MTNFGKPSSFILAFIDYEQHLTSLHVALVCCQNRRHVLQEQIA
jgi:hypothetical protein